STSLHSSAAMHNDAFHSFASSSRRTRSLLVFASAHVSTLLGDNTRQYIPFRSLAPCHSSPYLGPESVHNAPYLGAKSPHTASLLGFGPDYHTPSLDFITTHVSTRRHFTSRHPETRLRLDTLHNSPANQCTTYRVMSRVA